MYTLFSFSDMVSDKMSKNTYQCRTCNRLTIGYPALYRHNCIECRNLETRTMIEKQRLSHLTKNELELENRKLQEKLRNLKDIDLYDDDISFEEDPNHPNFILATPQTNVPKRKLFPKQQLLNNPKKSIDTDREAENVENTGSVSNSSKSDFEKQENKGTGKGKKRDTYAKMVFMKICKGPKRYLPGQHLQYKFESHDIDINDESCKVLTSILNKKKQNITKKIKRLFPGKELNFSQTYIHFPCPVKVCKYNGLKIRRHLESNLHHYSEQKSKTIESFLQYLNKHL